MKKQKLVKSEQERTQNSIADYEKSASQIQYNIKKMYDDMLEQTEQKIEQQKKIIDEKIISENPEIRYEIVAVSSRKALISKSNDFDVYNGEKLTEELRDARLLRLLLFLENA